MNGAKITIRLPQELYEQAKAKAKRDDITISQVLRRCLREWVADDASKEKEEKPTTSD